MQEVDYRLLAVEFVQQIQDLLVHPGSKKAFALAKSWASGEPVDSEVIDHARDRALESCVQCTDEIRDGRYHAAEAAWQLLAPKIEEWMGPIIENVARAKAARSVFKKHGGLTSATQDEFDYIRAVEQELLEDRLARRKARS
jgi:hypothetical protein